LGGARQRWPYGDEAEGDVRHIDSDGFDDGGTRAWRANQATWRTPTSPIGRAATGIGVLLFIRTLGRLAWLLGGLLPWLALIPALIVLPLWDAIVGH
jgi:hypothetical protein